MSPCSFCCWWRKQRGPSHASPVLQQPSTDPTLLHTDRPNPSHQSTDPTLIHTDLPNPSHKPTDPTLLHTDLPNPSHQSTDPTLIHTDLPNLPSDPSHQSKDDDYIHTEEQSSSPATSKNLPPTTKEVIKSLGKVNMARLDDFIHIIKQLLDSLTPPKDGDDTPSTSSSNKDRLSEWASNFQTGKTFLSFVSEQAEKSKDVFSGETAKIAGNILEQIGHIHWMVGALTITGYLILKCRKVSQNQLGCIELLKKMLELVCYIKHLNILIHENESNYQKKEKLANAFQAIIEGSMSCASQLNSGKFCRFIKSSIHSETLSGLSSKINEIYQDLNAIVNMQLLEDQPVFLPLSRPEFPKDVVGIEEQVKEINQLLDMETKEDSSPIVLLVWGFGGIGKTTLARAVVSTINRSNYNYTRIILDQASENNKAKYTEMQQQILRDAFPNYHGGRKIELRDNEDGKDRLNEAFRSKENKAVFLYIDNALHTRDLEELLPQDLGCLPQHSRIIITTRTLGIADMLRECGDIRIKDYPVKKLSDVYAAQILCKDGVIRDKIKKDLQKIVNVCRGIPLVLEIVGARLCKQKYHTKGCTQIIKDLEEGKDIKDLSDRLFHSVYKELDKTTQEAFIDICCVLLDDYPRQWVEYVVGVEEVTFLLDSALITPVMRRSDLWEDEDEECLKVHDIILSIGRRLGMSSRIVDEEAWAEAEKDEAKLKGIKAVVFDGSNEYSLEESHLKFMKERLRILDWNGRTKVEVRDKLTFPELRFLHISDGDISWLNIEALDELRLFVYHPTKKRDVVRLPESLRLLFVHYLNQPDASELLKIVPNSSLEELVLRFKEPSEAGDEETSESGDEGEKSKDVCVHPSKSGDEKEDKSTNIFNTFLRGLNNLTDLGIQNASFSELPEQVCKLTQLRRLRLQGYWKMERLPELFGQLTTLTHLSLADCFGLKQLPNSIGQLKSLQTLRLERCKSLKELPRGIEQLGSLKYLNLEYCWKLESDICQKDGRIKIVDRSSHSCDDCHNGKRLKVER